MKLVVEFEPNDGFNGIEAIAEVLFNFGIGVPEDGVPWLNMTGQAYHITDFKAGIS